MHGEVYLDCTTGLSFQLERLPSQMDPLWAARTLFPSQYQAKVLTLRCPNSIDVIVAASAIISSLQSVVARTVDPLESAVLSVTQVHAGSAMNVIPDAAELKGTMRYFKPDVRDAMHTNLHRIVERTAEAHGASSTVEILPGYPPTVNDAASVQRARAAAEDVFSSENIVVDALPTLGAEDFSYMLEKRPGNYAWIGAGPSAMLHQPDYDFPDEILPLGAAYFATIAERLLVE